jgi:CRISPR-associated endonuclease/helicase Cas3
VNGRGNGFRGLYAALTGDEPHPWQERLYREWFAKGRIPTSISLPTGTGKTSVMALWLLARASGAPLPRRLVWVVDRRVVVDQATTEAERLRTNLSVSELEGVREQLKHLSVSGNEGAFPVAISTLRGAFEDNGEWSEDPSRPSIIVGTVDMVGSRLLFSGYGDGRYRRPFHAGLLGRDALIVLDEAHLSRPFERLLRRIEELQSSAESRLPSFHFLPISATSISSGAFTLLPSERAGAGSLFRILRAPKQLVWHGEQGVRMPVGAFRSKVVECALRYKERTSRVVIYLDRLSDVDPILKGLSRAVPGRVVSLTGTLRGHERDALASDPVFARFLEPRDSGDGVAYLVSTSAGEVGINLYADQMVSDLVPVDRMIQRFGRVNRAGDGEATIDVCPGGGESTGSTSGRHRTKTRGMLTSARREAVERTETYLRALAGVSPGEIDLSPPPVEAFAPTPAHPPLRSWLLDAWSLTTTTRPDVPVESWLRGLDEDSLPDVHFAWREEIDTLADPTLLDAEDVALILQEYRLLPRELLRQDIGRARQDLSALGERAPDTRLVILSPQGEMEFRGRFRDLRDPGKPAAWDFPTLAYRTVLLPTTLGGLNGHGMMDASASQPVPDVSSRLPTRDWSGPDNPPPGGTSRGASGFRDHGWMLEKGDSWKVCLFGYGGEVTGTSREQAVRKARDATGLQYCVTFPLRLPTEDEPRRELVYLKSHIDPGSLADSGDMLLSHHLEVAGKEAEALTRKIGIPEPLASKLVEAARGHDLGKARRAWQEYAGNDDPSQVKAKSVHYRGPEILGGYRHELGSMVDLGRHADPLVRHLVATHHGYGRPHFPDRAADREHPVDSRDHIGLQLRQFVALQQEHGWWGLAYLEALLKAADVRASK